ncbi:LOW QUALITY PROTEIN: hypothetical protein V2J09_011862 [Rumex salicifolius]
MASKSFYSYLTTTLFILFLHLGCFVFSTPDPTRVRKRRKSPANLVSSSWSFLKRVFSRNQQRVYDTRPSSPRSAVPIIPQDTLLSSDPPRKRRTGSGSESELSDNPFFPLRNDIFPCTACGEIFLRPHLLEQHQSAQHAVSELRDGDPGKNVVWIIFKTGWAEKECCYRPPNVHRILKIHHRQKTLDRFEEFREVVKARAAIGNDAVWRRFIAPLFLGQNGNSALCGHQYCSMCGIIRAGFSSKLDGISTLATSWKAHEAVPDDMETEFSFMSVKRAMLVCRVIAGRVGYDPVVADKGDPGFDSVASCDGMVGGGFGRPNAKSDDDEILVFNPRAVLPCFVIVYSV